MLAGGQSELWIRSGPWPSERKEGGHSLARAVCSLPSGDSSEPCSGLSPATIEKEMRKLFNIPAERETRLWNKYMSNTYEQLSKLDNTVQDAGLYQGQVGGPRHAQQAAQPGGGAGRGARHLRF